MKRALVVFFALYFLGVGNGMLQNAAASDSGNSGRAVFDMLDTDNPTQILYKAERVASIYYLVWKSDLDATLVSRIYGIISAAMSKASVGVPLSSSGTLPGVRYEVSVERGKILTNGTIAFFSGETRMEYNTIWSAYLISGDAEREDTLFIPIQKYSYSAGDYTASVVAEASAPLSEYSIGNSFVSVVHQDKDMSMVSRAEDTNGNGVVDRVILVQRRIPSGASDTIRVERDEKRGEWGTISVTKCSDAQTCYAYSFER